MKKMWMAALLLLSLVVSSAQASIVVVGTRVIFKAEQGETTVNLISRNKHPNLVQVWLDNGDLHSTPDDVEVPFIISPPIFRMEAKSEHNIRIVFLPDQANLPEDRESVYWLNILEVPPTPEQTKDEQQNYLQFAFRSRIKLFYRPNKLKLKPQQALSKLSWHLQSTEQGYQLVLNNQSPYYLTLSQLQFDWGGEEESLKLAMLAPYSQVEYQLPQLTTGSVPEQLVLRFKRINDYGGREDHKAVAKWILAQSD